MSHREPAPQPCANARCTKLAEDAPEPGGTAGDSAHCSWACMSATDLREMWADVRRAKSASRAAQ